MRRYVFENWKRKDKTETHDCVAEAWLREAWLHESFSLSPVTLSSLFKPRLLHVTYLTL